jgi:hypothetical protein
MNELSGEPIILGVLSTFVYFYTQNKCIQPADSQPNVAQKSLLAEGVRYVFLRCFLTAPNF